MTINSANSLTHIYAIHKRALFRENDYEKPLVQLFKLLEGEQPISKILVDLLPEIFVQKIFVSVTPFSEIINCNSLKSNKTL